jgi:hypothetical protein
MQISFDKKFIFIHVAKTGGISIKGALAPYCYMPYFTYLNRALNKLFNCWLLSHEETHITSMLKDSHQSALRIKQDLTENRAIARALGYLQQQGTIKPELNLATIFDDFYKFAIVRNPWDREVSFFHYLKGMAKRNEKLLFGNPIHQCETFEQFIEWRYHDNLDSYGMFFHNQYEQLKDEQNNLMVDFVGKFETLNQDFATICDHLGLQLQLPHRNATNRKTYQDYYSDHTKNIIATFAAEDIEHFKYTF